MIQPINRPSTSFYAALLVAVLCASTAWADPRLEPAGDVDLPFEPVRAVVGSPVSQRVAVTDGMLDVAVVDGEGLLWSRRMDHPVSGMAFHVQREQGEFLVLGIGGLMAGSDDLSVRLLDAATGRESWRVDGFGGPVASGGDTLVVAGSQGAARLRWTDDAFTSDAFARQPVEVVAVSSDGGTVALVDFNATGGQAPGESPRDIRLFHVHEGEVSAGDVLTGHQHDIISLAFSGSDTLVSADHGGVVRAWSLDSGEARVISTAFDGMPGDDSTSGLLSASGDGRWIAGRFGSAVVLSTGDGGALDTLTMTIRQGPGHTVFAGDVIAHVVRPPTFPLPVVRWWTLDAPETAGAARADADPDWLVLAPAQRGLPTHVDDIDALVHAIAPEARPGDIELHVTRDGTRHQVHLVVENLKDDSIAALRYRIELREAGDRLHIARMTEQVRCQPRRGSQVFSAAPCR